MLVLNKRTGLVVIAASVETFEAGVFYVEWLVNHAWTQFIPWQPQAWRSDQYYKTSF